jgi:hypothetical protein
LWCSPAEVEIIHKTIYPDLTIMKMKVFLQIQHPSIFLATFLEFSIKPSYLLQISNNLYQKFGDQNPRK